MIKEDELQELPSVYTDLVVEKSNSLLRANMLEAQQQFTEAAELFAASATIEAELATIAQSHGQSDIALIHLISEMSCWAAAGDTYRALSQGQKILLVPGLTAGQKAHVEHFLQQLKQRRQMWMASWSYQAAAI